MVEEHRRVQNSLWRVHEPEAGCRKDFLVVPILSAMTAREIAELGFGAPYESDGNCELCNASGPTWMCEDVKAGEQLPFCANCILSAYQKSEQ